jgi:putative hydroxymethylpyrimidine transport system substrate-binding protein
MRKFAHLAGVVGLVLVGSACTSGATVTPTASPSGQATPGASAASPSPSPVSVTFVLNFGAGGYFANLIAGEAQGFFKDEGINISFIIPNSPSDVPKLVANGQAQFGLMHSTDVILARNAGVPVVSIGTTHQYGTAGVMAPIAKGLNAPKDLEGKTLGITGIPANKVMLQQMLRVSGVDVSKVKIVNIGFTGLQPLLAGQIDALGDAITWDEPIPYNISLSKDPNDTSTFSFIEYYKNGAPRYYTFGIVTSESILASNSDLAKRFMRAWVKSLQWSIDNPDQAVADLLQKYPDLPKADSLGIWKACAAIAQSDETKANGLGWQSSEVWAAQAQFMLDNGLINTPVDVSKAFTNADLPSL